MTAGAGETQCPAGSTVVAFADLVVGDEIRGFQPDTGDEFSGRVEDRSPHTLWIGRTNGPRLIVHEMDHHHFERVINGASTEPATVGDPTEISVASTETIVWSPPAGHTQTNGCWTPFLMGRYDELEQWARRHQVTIRFEALDDGRFGDYDPDVREVRLDPLLTARQVVSTLAHECAHAALGAYGGNWQHQEQRADEEATRMLVDPVAFVAAMTGHQDAMRDYRVAADLDVMVWVARSAQRLWSSSVGDRLDRLTGWTVLDAEHRRWVEACGWTEDREQAEALLEATYRRAVAVQAWSELDD